MARLLLTALTAVFILATPLQAFNWSGVFSQVQQSVVQLISERGSCTAFSIDQERKYYLTAAHCLSGDLTFWKEASTATGPQHAFTLVRVLVASKELDLAVLEGSEGFVAVSRGRMPRKGEEVASIGYAFGEPDPFIIGSIVAQIKEARSYARTRVILFKDNQDIGGMSGGPVVDTRGRLVGMVQSGITIGSQMTNIAYGTAITDLYAFTKAYWRY